MRTGTTDTAPAGEITIVQDVDDAGRPQLLVSTPPSGIILTRRNAAPLLAQLLAFLEPAQG